MINDEGFRFIHQHAPRSAKQHYLIGLNLPTTISVLKTMLSWQESRRLVCRISVPPDGIFHPKVYLIREYNRYHAYIGSANLTRGGLQDNAELCVRLDDEQICLSLLNWFKESYEKGFPLTKENINRYERWFNAQKSIYEQLQQSDGLSLIKSDETDPYEGVDFSDRFFSRAHHFAFRTALFKDRSISANKERRAALERFEELHEIIFPQFNNYGLGNLHPNVDQHLVSKDHHTNQNRSLDAMWLSYGKSQDEIKDYYAVAPKIDKNDPDNPQSFINHARIQIRIEFAEIGIWILFGKDFNGSIYDREYFRTRMRDQQYRKRFFDQLKALPESYWIEVNGSSQFVRGFTDADSLHQFCKADNPNAYFIIGRDYQITDPEMSKNELPVTTLREFQRLNPLYELMRHRF